MDTFTHGIIGALAGRAYTPSKPGGPTPTQRAVVGGFSAMFPDVDYATYWIDPLQFLSTWHRGPTHSLLLLPLWALLLGIAFAWLIGQGDRRRDCVTIAAWALLSHIATDLITVFGTAVLFPISEWRPGLGATLFIDGWLTGIALAGLLLCWGRTAPGTARACLALICVYVTAEAALQASAERFARSRAETLGVGPESVWAIAQPLSPFHWKAIVPTSNGYESSFFRLVGFPTFPDFAARFLGLTEMLQAYRPRDQAAWERHTLTGTNAAGNELAREVWASPLMLQFRAFAEFPILYRIDATETDICVWFTDLRFVFPGWIPSFRYGLCKNGNEGAWTPYRLRRGTLDERVSL